MDKGQKALLKSGLLVLAMLALVVAMLAGCGSDALPEPPLNDAVVTVGCRAAMDCQLQRQRRECPLQTDVACINRIGAECAARINTSNGLHTMNWLAQCLHSACKVTQGPPLHMSLPDKPAWRVGTRNFSFEALCVDQSYMTTCSIPYDACQAD